MISKVKQYPEYKDSGLLWLGKIPSHWEIRKLRTLLKALNERNCPSLPLLSVVREKGVIRRDVSNREENFNFIPDDLSNYKVVKIGQFAMNKMKAWQGSYGISKFDGIVSPAYFVFDLKGVVPEFFHHAIRSKAYVPFFGQASDGIRVGQWDLSQTRMKEIPFIIPSSEEQQIISEFIKSKNAQIACFIRAKRRLIELLNEQKQAIINKAVTKGINPNVKFIPSGIDWLGDIPEHWDVRKMSHVCQGIGSGTTPSSGSLNFYENGSIPWLITGDLKDCELFDCSGRITDIAKKTYTALNIFPKDILAVAMYGATVGKTAIIRFETTCNQACCMLYKFKDVTVEYLFHWFIGMRNEILSLSRGGGQPNINQDIIRSLRISLPNIETQNEIVKYIKKASKDIDLIISRAEREIVFIQEYRTRLISDVVTGKVDVRDIPVEPIEEIEEFEQGNIIDEIEETAESEEPIDADQ